MNPHPKAFDFLRIGKLPPKPRKLGVTEIRGPYYTSVTLDYTRALLADWGEYFDGFKFAGGSQRLLARGTVKKIIDSCHEDGVYVSTGGMVERVIVQGSKAVDSYFEECKTLGFDVIEISSGLASIELSDKVEMVKQVQKLGMKAKPEVTMMIGAGAGTHIVDYEEKMKMRSLKAVVNEIEAHLRAGAHMIMMESEGITEDLPPGKWRKDVIRALVDKFGYRKLMFEASDPPVFKWYLKNIGKDVNLFIDHSQVVEFNAWRLGLWGDSEIWRGRRLTYHGS